MQRPWQPFMHLIVQFSGQVVTLMVEPDICSMHIMAAQSKFRGASDWDYSEG